MLVRKASFKAIEYRQRYDHIDCGHKKFTFMQRSPIHSVATVQQFKFFFPTCSVNNIIPVFIALAILLSCENTRIEFL